MAAASQTTTDQDIQTENVEDQSKRQNEGQGVRYSILIPCESQELPKEVHLANKENSDLRCGFCSKFFTDARTLSCGHNFCFPCLIDVQQTDEVKSCHICKELTIPTQDKIKQLIPNRDVNQRVGKAMLDLVQKKPVATKKKTSDLCTHEGVECANCHVKNFAGARFICGYCSDFNLCAECEGKPREGIHEKTHLFIKLRKPAEKQPPKRPVLHDKAKHAGKALDFGKTHHISSTGSVIGRKKMFRAHSCNGCKTDVIVGARYKCGLCENYDLCEKCEENSDKLHDDSHVFVKIPCPMKSDVLDGKVLKAMDWIANPLPQNQIAADHMTHMMFNMAANSSDDDSDDEDSEES